MPVCVLKLGMNESYHLSTVRAGVVAAGNKWSLLRKQLPGAILQEHGTGSFHH
jgi:hypothetical protein